MMTKKYTFNLVPRSIRASFLVPTRVHRHAGLLEELYMCHMGRPAPGAPPQLGLFKPT